MIKANENGRDSSSNDITTVAFFDISATIDYICKIQREKNISQNELSALSGVPLPTLSKILNHRTPDPRFESVARIAQALNISLDSLTQKATEITFDDLNPELAPVEVGTKLDCAFLTHLVAAYQQVIGTQQARIHQYERQIKEKKLTRSVKDLMLVVVVVMLAFYLIWDITHPTAGYIQYEIYVKQLHSWLSELLTV